MSELRVEGFEVTVPFEMIRFGLTGKDRIDHGGFEELMQHWYSTRI